MWKPQKRQKKFSGRSVTRRVGIYFALSEVCRAVLIKDGGGDGRHPAEKFLLICPHIWTPSRRHISNSYYVADRNALWCATRATDGIKTVCLRSIYARDKLKYAKSFL